MLGIGCGVIVQFEIYLALDVANPKRRAETLESPHPMKHLAVAMLLSLLTFPVFGQSLPENASKNVYGSGWSCNKGYSRSGNSCVQIRPPENASLNYFGNGWECNRGFYKSGQKCQNVVPPKNASINYFGNGWECNRGYYKSGQSCAKVIIPKNARLNYLGNGWECNDGFKKYAEICVAMTAQEIQKREEVELAVKAELARRKALGVSGDNCDSEYKTNANVCVEITGGNIDCNESYGNNYYRDCDVTLAYEIRTDYSGGAYLDADVECRVEIEYKGRETYATQFDSSSQDESHSLYANGSDSETLRFNFSFSSYKEITSAKISSANCGVDSVTLY